MRWTRTGIQGAWLLCWCLVSLWLIVGCSGEVTLNIQGCEDCPDRCLSKDGTFGRCVPCLKDDHCRSKSSPTKKCSKNNQCVCGSDKDCPDGKYCSTSGASSGACVECTKDDHCADNKDLPVCVSGRCEACKPNQSRACVPDGLKTCGKGVQVCKGNLSWDVCKDYTTCKSGEVCVDEKCVPDCPKPAPCQMGELQCVTATNTTPGRFRACAPNARGCLDFVGKEQTCALNEYCARGKCIKAECPSGLTPCNGACVNLKSNSKNCGVCGLVCSNGQICSDGKCTLVCKGGLTRCKDACVELQNSQYHCGKCNFPCSSQEECKQGRCVPRCAAGESLCNNICVSLQTDNRHCGKCSLACAPDRVCATGACICKAPLIQCKGSCFDPKTSQNHCGRCGNACTGGLQCIAGRCTLVCPTGTQNCGGSCVDTQNNTRHCGTCGNVCNTGWSCSKGKCVLICPSGFTNCNGQCLDTQSNNSHCGACNKACLASETCKQGVCKPLCSSSETDCGGKCVNTSTDSSHCGGCNRACNLSYTCNNGVCGCPSGKSECNGRCVVTMTDNQHCGRCGNACAAGSSCQGGVCVVQCPSGKTNCNNVCVDLQTDAKHCGKCGTTCTSAQLCLKGTCQGNTFQTLNIGPFGRKASFSSRTRGFWFTAPTDFTIVALRVPTDVGVGAQSVAVVRFVSKPPTWTPSNPQTTNAFAQLFYKKGVTGSTWIPANIAIKKGQIIGILGARGSGTLDSSYGASNTWKTTIKGQSTELFRLIYQGGLDVSQPSNLAYAVGTYVRIEVRYQ